MADIFSIFKASLESPASFSYEVTPSDGANLAFITRAIYVGVTGDVKLLLKGDTANTTLKNVAVGYHPLRVAKIFATGTTANSIVALY